MKEDFKKILLRISTQSLQKVRQLASKENRTVTGQINHIINEWTSNNYKTKD